MDTFNLKVVASDKIFYDGECVYLMVPASDGMKGIMAHHERVAIAITMGELTIKTPGGEEIVGVVGNGIAQVRASNQVTVLVDTIERPEEIDEIRAREAKERAEERLRQKQSRQEYYHTQAALSRAMYRLKATQNYKRNR